MALGPVVLDQRWLPAGLGERVRGAVVDDHLDAVAAMVDAIQQVDLVSLPGNAERPRTNGFAGAGPFRRRKKPPRGIREGSTCLLLTFVSLVRGYALRLVPESGTKQYVNITAMDPKVQVPEHFSRCGFVLQP